MIKMLLAALWLCSQLASAAPPAPQVEIYDFKDPVLEQRYQTLTEQLRCLVCQNQNIADSHAELAQDLRSKVYELLIKGDNDEQIVTYMTDRYGDFVLYRPPFKFKTLLLWLAPALAILLGGFGFWRVMKNARQPKEQLPETELKSIRNLLDNE
jgi:cytochrome c-type biogenesis protein CcmH